jgi:hypothetical protein
MKVHSKRVAKGAPLNLLAVDTTGEAFSIALQARDKIFSVHRVFRQPHDENWTRSRPQAARGDLPAFVSAWPTPR